LSPNTQGLIIVNEISESEVKFCSYGGGWNKKMDSSEFFERFRKVDRDELTAIEWKPAEFDIDGAYGDEPAKGYSKGLLWNGWAQPAFEKEGIERIREIFNAGESAIYLDDKRDVVVVDLGPEVDEDSRFEEYEGFDIVVEGGEIKHVYGVGAGAWVWDEIRPDNQDDD